MELKESGGCSGACAAGGLRVRKASTFGLSADYEGASKGRQRTSRLIVTGCLVLEFFRLALFQEILGPTLPFLRSQIRSDYAAVTQAISSKAMGLVIGATLGGLLLEKLRRFSNLIICVCTGMSACWIAALPFAPHVGLYWAAFTTMGLLEGVINTFGQGVLLKLWQEKAAAPMHLLHLGFGLGSCLMPLLASLFFPKPAANADSGTKLERVNHSCVVTLSGTTLSQALTDATVSHLSAVDVEPATIATDFSTSDVDPEGSLVHYSYVMLSIFGAACATVFGCLYVAERRERIVVLGDLTRGSKVKSELKLRDSLRLHNCLPHSHVKVALLLAFMALFAAVLTASDRVFGSFIFIYAKSSLCFNDAEAVALNSAFWGVFTGGRAVGFFASHRVQPRFLLLTEVSGATTCCLALAIFGGPGSSLVTWISCLGAALFLGPAFPSLMAWANRYIDVTGMAITLILLGVAAGAAACLTLVGYYVEHNGTDAVVYFAAGLTGMMLVTAVALQIVGSSIGDRFDRGDQEEAEKMEDREMNYVVPEAPSSAAPAASDQSQVQPLLPG